MFSAGPGGAWSQTEGHARTAMVVGGRLAPTVDEKGGRLAPTVDEKAGLPAATKEKLALRKKDERANTIALWTTLELLAPIVDENKAQPGYRSKALRGRAKEELLKDVMHAVRLAQGPRLDDFVLGECLPPRIMCLLEPNPPSPPLQRR